MDRYQSVKLMLFICCINLLNVVPKTENLVPGEIEYIRAYSIEGIVAQLTEPYKTC